MALCQRWRRTALKCVCVSVYVCIMYACMYVMYVHMYTCMYVRMYVYNSQYGLDTSRFHSSVRPHGHTEVSFQ